MESGFHGAHKDGMRNPYLALANSHDGVYGALRQADSRSGGVLGRAAAGLLAALWLGVSRRRMRLAETRGASGS